MLGHIFVGKNDL